MTTKFIIDKGVQVVETGKRGVKKKVVKKKVVKKKVVKKKSGRRS